LDGGRDDSGMLPPVACDELICRTEWVLHLGLEWPGDEVTRSALLRTRKINPLINFAK
jgi:hypothetical protein